MTSSASSSQKTEFSLETLLSSYQMRTLMRENIAPELSLRDQLSLSRVSTVSYQVMKNRPFCKAIQQEAYLVPQREFVVAAIAAHPSQPLVAWPNGDTIKIWSLATREVYRTLSDSRGHDFQAIAWSPDGQRLATGGWGSQITIWSLETGKVELLHSLATGRPAFSVPAWSSDGRFIALVSDTGEINVWPADKETGPIAFKAKPRSGERSYVVNNLGLPEEGPSSSWIDGKLCNKKFDSTFSTVATSCDGKYTAVGSSRGKIRVWEWKTKELVWKVKDDSCPITALAFCRRTRYLASGNTLGVVTIFSLRAKKDPGRKFQGFCHNVTGLCWTFDNGFLIGCGGPNGGGRQVRIWRSHGAHVEGNWDPVLSCSPDGQKFIARDGLGSLVIKAKPFDFRSETLPGTQKHRVLNGCWTADSKAFITMRDGEGIYLWSTIARTSRLVKSRDPHDLMAIAWAPDGESFATAHWDGRPGAIVWSAKTGESMGSLYGHALSGAASGTRSIAYNPDLTSSCASGHWQSGVHLWDSTKDGYFATSRNNSTDKINLTCNANALEWTDATHLSIGHGSWHTRYDTTSRTSKWVGGHWDTITCFALSPDGTHMASAGKDSLIVVWDLQANSRRHIISGFPGALEEVVWSSASEIIGRGADGHIAVWKWNQQTSQAVMRWCSSPLRFEYLKPVDTKVVNALQRYTGFCTLL